MRKAFVAVFALLAAVSSVSAQNDVDILNFALNLECLEAAFYSCAAYGANLTTAYLGGGGPVVGCQQADLKGPALSYAEELAQNELDHVRLLRINLGNQSVACPAIDIGPAFAKLGAAAYNVSQQVVPFSPYFDVFSFYLGAFIFEDVGVTAYKGAAPLILNKVTLGVASSILATESYHGGIIRALISQSGFVPLPQLVTVEDFADHIAAARELLSDAQDDAGVSPANGVASLVPADSNGIAYSRTPQQVLQVVYGTGDSTKPGLFFPQGVTGYFSPTNLLNG